MKNHLNIITDRTLDIRVLWFNDIARACIAQARDKPCAKVGKTHHSKTIQDNKKDTVGSLRSKPGAGQCPDKPVT